MQIDYNFLNWNENINQVGMKIIIPNITTNNKKIPSWNGTRILTAMKINYPKLSEHEKLHFKTH